MNPLVFLRVGFMEAYDGPGEISGGGAYVDEHDVGGEVLNFRSVRGKCYGWARTFNEGGLNLDRIAPGRTWSAGDTLPGVDVVFFARRPIGGQVIVGFYRGATVLHRRSVSRSGTIPGMEAGFPRYICEVDSPHAYLIPSDQREFMVPTAGQEGRGSPGQSNVWYPDPGQFPKVSRFVADARKYLLEVESRANSVGRAAANRTGKAPGWPVSPDAAWNAEVEARAVGAVRAYFVNLGWEVRSVERDNVGWDLEVANGTLALRVEVKGRSNAELGFELTPNEYLKLQEHFGTYRVALVCSVFDRPEIHLLEAARLGNGWVVRSASGDVSLQLGERIAAVAKAA